jgi:hypothetical protein
MIRYELYSNVANSDQGLQGPAALQELAESLRAQDIECRVIRIVQREEGEINLASSQFARGVTVKSTAVRNLSPEASLKGMATWLRQVTSRVDRGLHVHLEQVRQTNGAAVVIAQVLAAGRHAFVTGLDDARWARMTAVPDFTGQRIPASLVSSSQGQGEYLMRRTRPAGFWPMLQHVVDLGILAPLAQAQCAALVKSHDPAQLAQLSEALVINLGVIADGLERVDKLVEQFTELISTAEAAGELPLLFDLIAKDVPFAQMYARLLPLTLEAKRSSIGTMRALVNEVRIGLAKGQGTKEDLKTLMLPLVVHARLKHDPAAYLAATRMQEGDADTQALLAPVRKQFLELKSQMRAELAGAEGLPADPDATALPLPLKLHVFELIVQLTYLGQYTQRFRDDQVPGPVQAVRELLTTLVFDVFDIGQLRHLKSSLPPKGVARNLAERVPLSWGDLLKNMETLEEGLYPYAQLAADLAGKISGTFKSVTEQKRVDRIHEYLRGSVHLLRLTTYMLGNAGLNAASWQLLLEAGRSLGLTVYASRDELRQLKAGQADAEGQLALQGTVLLMQRDDSRMFPLRARPELIMLAYRYLARSQVALATRSFLAHKLNYLVTRYGSGLFEVLYQHLTWTGMLRLSRRQLWEILAQSKVLDAERLKELGYRADEDARSTENENPWLAPVQLRVEGAPDTSALRGDALEHTYRDAYNSFLEFVQRFPRSAYPPGEGPVSLRVALGELFRRHEVFSPNDPEARKLLAGTHEAEALGQSLVMFLGMNDSLLSGQDPEEAYELALPGRLAVLSLLKDRFTVTLDGASRLVRVVPAAGMPDSGARLAELDPAARAVAEFFASVIGVGASSLPEAEPHLKLLAQAVPLLSGFRTGWANLMHVSTVTFIDQALRETVLKLIQPGPPAPAELVKLPEEQVLCLGPSTFHQAKFHRVVARVDRKDAYLTLSEMAGWLTRLQQLREEMRYHRDLIADIQGIIRSFNLSVFDAAYVLNYGRELHQLDQALNVRPEQMTAEDVRRIQERARSISHLLRSMYDQESALRMRDRWLNRIVIQLRRQRANVRINFVDVMWESGTVAPPPSTHPDAADSASKVPTKDARTPEFQTFSERMRQCIEFRARMAQKQYVILSPANTQKNLTLNLIDQLFRLKGLSLTVMVDISSADSFEVELLSRVPPHRLFNMNDL